MVYTRGRTGRPVDGIRLAIVPPGIDLELASRQPGDNDPGRITFSNRDIGLLRDTGSINIGLGDAQQQRPMRILRVDGIDIEASAPRAVDGNRRRAVTSWVIVNAAIEDAWTGRA